jgi:hypothetical protein
MRWTVIVAEPAQKQLAKFPARDQLRIEAAIRAMTDDPFPATRSSCKGWAIAGAAA